MTPEEIVKSVMAGVRASGQAIGAFGGPAAPVGALLTLTASIVEGVMGAVNGDVDAARERLQRIADLDRRLTAKELADDDATVRAEIKALYAAGRSGT